MALAWYLLHNCGFCSKIVFTVNYLDLVNTRIISDSSIFTAGNVGKALTSFKVMQLWHYQMYGATRIIQYFK